MGSGEMPARLHATGADAAGGTLRVLACASWAILVCTTFQACTDSTGTPPATPGVAAAGTGASAAPELGAPVAARFVKLEQLTEASGKPFAAIAEFNLLDSTGATVERTSWTATADSAAANDPASNAVDGRPDTFWHSQWEGANPPPPPHALTVDLGSTVRLSGFRVLPRQDAVGNGTIAKYRFYVSIDGVQWNQPVSEGDLTARGPQTAEKAVAFARQTPNQAPVMMAPPSQRTPMGQAVNLPLTASDADADPLVYQATGLPSGLQLTPGNGRITGTPIVPGAYAVEVSVKDNKGLLARASFSWTVEAPAAGTPGISVAAGEVRFVKLEQLSEIAGKPWGSIAELKLLDAKGNELPRTGWTAAADSADASDQPAYAIDGNPATLWHSQWDGSAPPPPHTFVINLGTAAAVRGFRYLPRQDRMSNGIFAKYRFYTSVDGVQWGSPVAEGDFSTMGKPEQEKTVLFK